MCVRHAFVYAYNDTLEAYINPCIGAQMQHMYWVYTYICVHVHSHDHAEFCSLRHKASRPTLSRHIYAPHLAPYLRAIFTRHI